MIVKKGKSEITFVYQPYTGNCNHVQVAGTFNDWQPGQGKMARQKDGSFRKRVKLEPGEYRYRFIVDGQWVDDPDAGELVPNMFGSRDAVLRV